MHADLDLLGTADTCVGLVRVVHLDGDPVERWTVEWRATGPEEDHVTTTVHSGRRPARHR